MAGCVKPRRSMTVTALVVTLLAMLLAATSLCVAGAEVKWVPDGIPMTLVGGDDGTSQAVPDGAGGAVIVWKSNTLDIGAQRVDSGGNLLWGANGIQVFSGLSGTITGFHAIADGAGGAFVVCDEASGKVHAQHVDGTGSFPWGAVGTVMHTGSSTSVNPRLCSDGAGGIIAAWEDKAIPGADYDIIAQRVNAAGFPQWAITPGGGAPVYAGAGEQTMPQVAAGNANEAIVSWQDDRSGADNVYAQLMTGGGIPAWNPAGIQIGTGGWSEYDSYGITADGVGGAIIAWEYPGATPDIYAQRVANSGNALWQAGGFPVCAASAAQWRPQVVSNQAQGAFVAWDDYRTTNGDIYCQNMTSAGQPYWMADGFQVTLQPDAQREVRAAPDGAGGIIMTWMDARHGWDYEVYAQRLNDVGNEFWTSTGARVCSRENGYCVPSVANTAPGEAIISWDDTRNTGTSGKDIYAQRIITTGAGLPTTWYFAEGTTRNNFEQYISIENANAAWSEVKITYMLEGGATREQVLSVPGRSRATVNVNSFLGAGVDNSAQVETVNNVPIVAERPMYFNYDGVWTGGHDVVGANQPQDAWYFAEGTTRPGFRQYICLQNPGTTNADVTITYMLENSQTQQQALVVGAKARVTVPVHAVLGEGKDNSARVVTTNGTKIVAERPMYFNYNGVWTGGHCKSGALAAADAWYFAEGTTRAEFDQYICLQNPEAGVADVKITYMKEGGATQEQTLAVPPESRTTVNVKQVLGVGVDNSCKVETTNGTKIVAERPMYFNYKGVWTGGHDVVGTNAPSDTWYFAEGTTRTNFEEWICLQNPNAHEVEALLTYMQDDGNNRLQTVALPPTSRVTVWVNNFIYGEHDVSVRVESSDGSPIIAERPMYFNYQGRWTGGHDVLGY